jgi:hypothetical protein
MQPMQQAGLRILFMSLGWGIGYFLFGDEEGLFSIPIYGWCGILGLMIGFLLGGKPKP